MELMFRVLATRQSEWRRANPRNVNFAISSRWKFDPWQLVWYQILVFQFPTDEAPQFLSKLSFHCFFFYRVYRVYFIEFVLNSEYVILTITGSWGKQDEDGGKNVWEQ